MKRVLLIGIDSLEPALLTRYAADLPNFTRLRQQSPVMKSTSVFPVDSIPAWVSIYTGQNPARHGIVKTFDIFDSGLGDILKIDQRNFRGKTFWDYAGNAGKKVCVLLPLLGYPPWPVNGLMVSRGLVETGIKGEAPWRVNREIQARPELESRGYKLPVRGVHGGHPGNRNLAAFVSDCVESTLEEAALGLKVSQDFAWALFFICFDALDIVQHRLWRFYDEHDPAYPGPTPLQDSIKHFYQQLDGIVGRFMTLHPDAVTLVFSDHGHGIRPAITVNLNEVLRQDGLLISTAGRHNPLPHLVEEAKNHFLNGARRLGLDGAVIKLATRTKGLSSLSKNLYMATGYIDRSQTVAHLSSFAGVKSYGHGGVEIIPANLNSRSYEEVRDRIIKLLSGLKEPRSGESLVAWVDRRENLYRGEKIAQAYPDIVFELKEGYGTGWGVHTRLIGRAQDHNLAPGGHKKNAVFLLTGTARAPVRREMTLMDIAPTVLDLLEVKGDFAFDGRSIFGK